MNTNIITLCINYADDWKYDTKILIDTTIYLKQISVKWLVFAAVV